LAEVIGFSKKNLAADVSDAVPAVAFDDLGIEQAGIDAPGAAAFIGGVYPGSEMGRQGIEVERQAIAGENRQTTWGQALSDVVDELMGELLGARAEGEGWDQFGAGVGGDPKPFGLGRTIEFRTNLIELNVS
jgi:hypothetical protein